MLFWMMDCRRIRDRRHKTHFHSDLSQDNVWWIIGWDKLRIYHWTDKIYKNDRQDSDHDPGQDIGDSGWCMMPVFKLIFGRPDERAMSWMIKSESSLHGFCVEKSFASHAGYRSTGWVEASVTRSKYRGKEVAEVAEELVRSKDAGRITAQWRRQSLSRAGCHSK
jgi:hypothetical protein